MYRRPSRTGWAILVVGLLGWAIPAFPLPTTVFNAQYTARGVAHVRYSFSKPEGETWAEVRIRVATGADTGWTPDWSQSTVLTTLPATNTNTQILRLSGWNTGDDRAVLKMYVVDQFGTEHEMGGGIGVSHLRPFGTPEFSETLSGAVTTISVTVPEGVAYTVGQLDVPDGATNVGGITVNGTLSVSHTGRLPMTLTFNSPHSLRLPEETKATFNAGAAGSQVSGGRLNIVTVNAPDMTFSDMADLRLSGPNPFRVGSLTVNRCTFRDFPLADTFDLASGQTLTLSNCDFTASTRSLRIQGGTSARIERCVGMRSITVMGGGGASAQIIGTDFALTSNGTNINPSVEGIVFEGNVTGTIHDCDVGQIRLVPITGTTEPHPHVHVRRNTIRGNLELRRPLPIAITDNLITGSINIGTVGQGGSQPTIRGNSFLGREAIAAGYSGGTDGIPIAIGENYYGDAHGPVLVGDIDDSGTFMVNRGARIRTHGWDSGTGTQVQLFQVARHAKTGKQYDDRRFFPDIWASGRLAGQITLPHASGVSSSLEPNVPTYVTFDVASSHGTVRGVKFYGALYNQVVDFQWVPTILYPVHTPDSLNRDGRLPRTKASVDGSRYVSFLIPHEMATYSNLNFRLYADCSGVSGYDVEGSASTEIDLIQLNYQPRRATRRPLLIEVIPVKLSVPSLPNSTPDGSGFAHKMKRAILATMPIREDQLEIRISPPYQFEWGGWPALQSTVFLNELAGRLAMLRFFEGSASDRPAPDFRVAVLAGGAMGPETYGASLVLRRSILIVDERSPATMLHEWGHFIGLYNILEQYTTTRPNGILIESATMAPANGGRDYLIDGEAVWHVPPADHFASGDAASFYTDIMGDGASAAPHRFWPTRDTLASFRFYINNIIYGPGKADAEDPKEAEETKWWVPTGTRRIHITGLTVREDDGAGGERYRFERGSLRAIDMTRLPDGTPTWPNTTGPGDACTITATGDPDTPNWSSTFYVASSDGLSRERDIWVAAFHVPANATRLTITRNAEPTSPYLDIVTANNLTASLLKPAADTVVGTDLEIEWQTSCSSTGQPLQFVAIAARWVGATSYRHVLDIFENRSKWTIPTSIYQTGDVASIAILVSDGLREQIVNAPLIIANRPPRARIVSPPAGTRLAPGATIRLVGLATDDDRGDAGTFEWSSDLDGVLGTTESLDGVVLSEGFHRITFEATDSASNTGTAMTTVSVHPFDELDLKIEPNALALSGTGADPVSTVAERLSLGQPHRAAVTFRNEGAPTTATLALAILESGAPTHRVLFQQEYALDAFEPVTFGAAFTPAVAGDYLLGAWVWSDTYPDPDESNNLMLWNYSTEVSPARAVTNLHALNFAQRDGLLEVEVWNVGQTSLSLGAVSIDGANRNDFAVTAAPPPGTVLNTGEHRTVAVRFALRSNGPKFARLTIGTSDPINAVLPVALSGEAPSSGTAADRWDLQ
ncbi:MAG: hypothetical protein KF858_14120 [Candidatus Sumerlaeia bacterium]|nr:hypothetical protein [Candidatus Sumerlaeia bacterium]